MEEIMISKRLSIKPFIILLVLGLACQNFGPISFRFEGLLILTSLIVYFFSCNPLITKNVSTDKMRDNHGYNLIITILQNLLFISFAVVISQITNDLIQLFSVSAFLAGLFFFSQWQTKLSTDHAISLLTSIFFSFTIFFYQYFSDYWYFTQFYANVFSEICGFIYSRVLNLSPSSFGFFIFISFVIYQIVIFGLGRNRSIIRLLLAITYLFFVTVVVVGINLSIVYFLKKTTFIVDRNDLHTQLLVFLISSPSILFYKNIEFNKISIFSVKKSFRYTVPCIVIFGICIFIFIIPFFKSESIGGKKVAFYKEGSLDWEIPRFGKYGQRSGGMFGFMPRHLKAMGFNTVMIDKIKTDNLAESDVLVMINLNHSLNQDELEVIWAFVKNGGGLLILGDHTNLAGLMVNFNKVLGVVNIKFKFNSAMPARYTWDSLMDRVPHPISSHFSLETARSWWVGASVTCNPPAEPIVIGKYCYSDWGYKNNKKNAYLGNRKFDYYEHLNDQVLAAYARFGKGKIMVCGDTSSFHNTTFMITHPFVLNTFKFLANNDNEWNTKSKRTFMILLSILIISCAVFTFLKKINLALPLFFVSILGLAVIISHYCGSYRKDDNLPYDKLKVAYIDCSHKGRFDLMSWEDDSIGGLRNNLLRNGFFPKILSEFEMDKLMQAKLIVFIAPTQSFSKKEVKILNNFVKNGGKILISVGWEEMDASIPILEHFGLEIDNVPLGLCQSDYKKTKVQFHEAWPVIFDQANNIEVVSNTLGFPAIVSKRYGEGSIILIADSYFLLNENLEGSKKFSTPNIFLLSDLLMK